MAKLNEKIGFIGAGNMCEAMVGALIRSDISAPSSVSVSDVSNERLDIMGKTYGVGTRSDNFEVFTESDIVVLAVKPQIMDPVLSDIAGREGYGVRKRKLVISIAAGIPIRKIENLLYAPLDEASRRNLPIVRVMPNTPALVLAGMSGMSVNPQASPEDTRAARTILEGMGKVIEFSEKDLDAVTALSGSGPAYVFYLAESMIDAGITLGLEPRDAVVLTLETLKGAVALMEKREETPEDLRRKVTSPGGTTEAAFKVLESSRVKGNIIDAVSAAAARSKALSG